MNRRGWYAVVWVAYLSIIIVVLSWLFSKLGPWQRHLGLMGITSAGVLLLIEAALLHGWTRDLQRQLQHDESLPPEKTQPGDTSDREKKRNDLDARRRNLLWWRNWFLRVGASLILTSAGFISSWFCPPPCAQNPQGTVQFSGPLEKALIDYLASAPKTHEAGPPPSSVVRLDPGLEVALWQHLRNPGPPAPTGIPRWGILTLIALTLVVLIGVVWWSLSQKPEATPLTVAIATLTAVSGIIEKWGGNAEISTFSHLPWFVVVLSLTLLIVGAALLFEGWRYFSLLRRDRDFIEQGSLLGAALLVFGLSAISLALVPALLLHAKPVAPNPHPQCPQGAMAAQKVEVFSVKGIDGLGDRPEDKNITREKLQQLTDDLGTKNAKARDILLLLGSADCVATKPQDKGGIWKDNAELANARATWVRDSLHDQPAVKDMKIETLALPEHARCGPSRNVRAVYSFLIHAEDNSQVSLPSTK